MKRLLLFSFTTILSSFFSIVSSQESKVVLQAFWWKYWNSNYPSSYSNYLAEMAPRLREMGIDAVWIPPSVKGPYFQQDSTRMRYAPFDHYDLGDKYQKGVLKTRMGDKNEFLRMIAVMHANGIEVIQDVVLNHKTDAGAKSNKLGGVDPMAWDDGKTNKEKNFRYVCYETPSTDESANDYLSRKGRWSKNWQNFHPNPADNSSSGVMNSAIWGPDICYKDDAFGKSSNAIYNPDQYKSYMKINARNWLIWMKKQTGIDGFRFDAVKHFETSAMKDFLYNLQNNAGWASGGKDMFSVGEYVDFSPTGAQNTWCTNVDNLAGAFDFALRNAMKGIIDSNGSYDLSQIPGMQQSNRLRTVSFVNNHDTYRPLYDNKGNIIGWDNQDELGGHINPKNERIAALYAIIMAVDGSPQLFLEDVFNLNSTSKRYTHLPNSKTDLPENDDIVTLVKLSKRLDFKGGAYKVPYKGADHLIIERAGKAIIGITDSKSTIQKTTITTKFPAGTILVEYGGSFTNEIIVPSNQQIEIKTPPCDGSSGRKGYSVWAPKGIAPMVVNPEKYTTQEWEMNDDLGDSHVKSLQQGGKIPNQSTDYRIAGKIFVEAGKEFNINLYAEKPTYDLTLTVAECNNGEVELKSVSGIGTLTLTYTPAVTGFITIKAKNSSAENPSQKVWIKANYIAPAVVNTKLFPSQEKGIDCQILNVKNQTISDSKLILNPNPAEQTFSINVAIKHIQISDLTGKLIKEFSGAFESNYAFDIQNINSGLYVIFITDKNNNIHVKKLMKR